MSEPVADAAQVEEVEAPPEEKTALGTGAREAVDGDLTKSYVPDDVSPNATIATDVVPPALIADAPPPAHNPPSESDEEPAEDHNPA